jgi:hypothetical protein
MIGRADPREHRQLRRVERTAAQKNLAFGRGVRGDAAACVLDAVGAGAVEQHPTCVARVIASAWRVD